MVYGERAQIVYVVEDVQVHYDASQAGVGVLGICILWDEVSAR